MVNNSNSRIMVKDLSGIGGISVTLVKQDKSCFLDSEVDKVFWMACEYSQHGPSSIERFVSNLVVTFEDIQEGRDFIDELDPGNDKINIDNIINVVFSKIHDTWVEVALARKEGGSFSDLEIQSIFWNAFQYPSLRAFGTSNNESEVRLHFKNVDEWYEFMQQFAGKNDRSKIKVKVPAKTKKKGFFERIAEIFSITTKTFEDDDIDYEDIYDEDIDDED